RDWNSELLAESLEPADGSSTYARSLLLNYYFALDSGRVEEAGEFISQAAQLAGKFHELLEEMKQIIFCEHAFWLARCGGDSTEAESILRKLGQSPSSVKQVRLRADAAVALANGDTEQALQRVAEAE